jgi:hypothetical protein
MAYYTGTDVKVWITTEHDEQGITVATDGNIEKLLLSDTGFTTSNSSVQIPPRETHLGYTGYNLADITGVDLSVGAMDEDISYFGTKTVGKSKVKDDITVTITKKKNSTLFALMAQGTCKTGSSQDASGKHTGKWGLILGDNLATGAAGNMRIANGTTDPKSSTDDNSRVSYGYRVAIQLKGASSSSDKDGTVLVLRNCSLGAYTHTVSNDAANDETIELVTMVAPLVLNGVKATNIFAGGVEHTAATLM